MGKFGSVLGQIVVIKMQGSNGLGDTMIGYVGSEQLSCEGKADHVPQ